MHWNKWNPKISVLPKKPSSLPSKKQKNSICQQNPNRGSEFFLLTKNRTPKSDVLFTMERATRLARGTAVPRHAQRATNAPPGRFLASLAPCSTLCPLEPKNKGMTYVMPLFFGAGDEARTRYLHLGKVALYQMSYARGTLTIIADSFAFVKPYFSFFRRFWFCRLANAEKL